MLPKRSEVWNVDLGMVGKVRPAVVISVPFTDADRSVISIVPHYTTLRGSPWEIEVPVRFLKPGAFVVQSVTSVDRHRLEGRVGVLNPEQMSLIESGLRRWLDLYFVALLPLYVRPR